jgi:hypothetical protein
VLLTLAAVVVLAGLVAASSSAQPTRVVFRVTLKAQLTKTWNYVSVLEEGECVTTTRVTGSRSVTLSSRRPTLVTVTFPNRRVRFSPSIVRSLSGTASQSGAVTTTEGGGSGCRRSSRHVDCARARRAFADQAARFFRSARNEISFARTRDFAAGLPTSCPPQAEPVRAERPGLQLAEGEFSERALRNVRIPSQAALGSVEETTDFQGPEDGKVVVRVSWELTFARGR